MAHRFKKNNYVLYSDSEDSSYSDGDSVASTSSDSLESSKESSDQTKDFSSESLKNDNGIKNLSDSFNSNECSSGESSNISQISEPTSDHDATDKEIKSDCNANKYSKKSCDTSRQSIVKHSIQCEISDIIVLDSSLSAVNDSSSIIDDSGNDIPNHSPLKTPFRTQDVRKDEIVEESSDSEASVEIVDSLTTATSKADTLHNTKENINLSDLDVVVESCQTNKPPDNNTSLPLSTIAGEGSASKIPSHTTDEFRILQQQLLDKNIAYQNIMRAVKFCDPRKLKDGGKLLKEKLALCKQEMDELKEKVKNFSDIPDNCLEKYSIKTNALFSTSDQVTANLGKKGLETHRVQAALTVDALVTLQNSLETCPAEDVHEKDPKGLRVELMPHQKYALAWLLWREQQVPAGGILADDMGLGKTLTMIALILRSNEYNISNTQDEQPYIVNNVKMYHGKTLVICPSSLIGQWQGQIKQHCKSHLLSVMIHHGKPRELQAKKLAAYDIVITSYGIVVEENKIIRGEKKGALLRVRWKRVIIDEGHVIRNHKTKTAQALCELEAKCRWCLTGTPVQNKELDMYSLLKFLRCSPFDNITVWKKWVDNKSANGVQRLNTVVKSILLRRTKEELKTLGELDDLPCKKIIPIYVKLDEEEQKVYQTVLYFSKTLLAEYILQEQKKVGFVSDELKSEHHKLLNAANEIKTTEIFVLLLRLRQICCLPALIHAMLEKESCAEDGIDVEDDPILQDLTSQMKRMSVVASGSAPDQENEDFERKKKILIESNPVFQTDRPSVKIRTVIKIIQEALEAGDKIVVVSQWSNLLKKLKSHILPLSIGVVSLDGSIPVKFRQKIIDDFNDSNTDIKVMLLSLTAGGVGLNLMGGNRLVIVEPHWNPQLESQACDRIYRVGQKKQVYIYKIICQNTIEEKIELLQKKKLEVANTILKGELKLNKHKITLADLKILFDVHEN